MIGFHVLGLQFGKGNRGKPPFIKTAKDADRLLRQLPKKIGLIELLWHHDFMSVNASELAPVLVDHDKCAGVCLLQTKGDPLGSKSERRVSLGNTQSAFEFAWNLRNLGVKYVVITGPSMCVLGKSYAGDAFGRAVDFAAEVFNIARDFEIVACIEPLQEGEDKVIGTVPAAVELCKRSGSDNPDENPLKVHVDTFHMWCRGVRGEDFRKQLSEAGPWVGYAHLSGPNRAPVHDAFGINHSMVCDGLRNTGCQCVTGETFSSAVRGLLKDVISPDYYLPMGSDEWIRIMLRTMRKAGFVV
jgi:hypothetical protein